jgi:TRAP-type C4-dicarboxylate transport system substrate-binding protein
MRKFNWSEKEIEMSINRLFYVLIVVFLMVTSCAPQVAATPAEDQPITLRLAVADAEGRPSEPYVLEFIAQVKTLSNNNITIEPSWDAGADTTPSFEQGVIKALMDGQYDLGLAGSRAFDTEKVTSFQALQAPFLITNDSLSKEVATSDIATRMLDSLSSSGMVGLTLWPEDLRHPFSIIPEKSLVSPEDFAGMNIRATPSDVTYTLIETLDGSPVFGDSSYEGAESGLRQGFSLDGIPIATGNVTFFAKYQVLFANSAAFEKLSDTQRAILREAATATQKKAIAEHPSEVDAAAAWCGDGRTIVLASEDQVAAFEAAAQPVFDKIEENPLNAELIAAIRELKTKTEPAPGAETCEPEVTESMPTQAGPVVVKGLIAFRSNHGGSTDIYVMNGSASELINLTNDPTADDLPDWSPDATQIAFCSFRDGKSEVYTMNADGSQQTNLSNDLSEDCFPSWSSDGTKIVFGSERDGNLELYVMNADGSGQTRLTDQPGFDGMPDWSPDGKQIVFVSDRDGQMDIYVMNADGSGVSRLTNNGLGNIDAGSGFPKWSPDGTKIAFGSGSASQTGLIAIYAMNADGSGVTRLTLDPSTNYGPSWSPDGTQILFSTERHGKSELYVMNADGSGQTRLTDNLADDQMAVWQP